MQVWSGNVCTVQVTLTPMPALLRTAAGVATLTLAQHEGHQVMLLDKQMKQLELHASDVVLLACSACAKFVWGS